jgi:hypothetical protein
MKRTILFCIGGLLALVASWAKAAAPTISQITTSIDANLAADISVVMPATIAANDLIVVLVCDFDGYDSTITPANGFALMSSQNRGRPVALWKKADGTEDGSTISVGSGGTSSGADVSFIVSGAADPAVLPPESSTRVDDAGAGTSIDPPDFDPSFDTQDILWIAWACFDDDPLVTGWPTGYDDNQTRYTYTSANAGTQAFATKGQVFSGTDTDADNPSAFTINASHFWNARTLAIPAAGSSVAVMNGTVIRRPNNYSYTRFPR